MTTRNNPKATMANSTTALMNKPILSAAVRPPRGRGKRNCNAVRFAHDKQVGGIVLSVLVMGHGKQEVIDEGGDDGARCRRDAAIAGEVGGIALNSEVSE